MATGSQVYILSGLGADERVFTEIDFGPFDPVFIPWEKLASPDQTFESYIEQLSRQVQVPDPILIGISLGGIVAQEMSRLFNDCPVLIIASVKTRQELSPLMRFSGRIRLHQLMPIKRVLKTKWLNYWLFGTKTETEKKILDQILADSDPEFTKWAIGQVSNWKRKEPVPGKVLHIHGDRDRIFRIGNVTPNYIIPEGTHFMTVSQPEKLSRVIRDALSKLSNQ
ncbi:hypothetical protein D3C87_371250 [compost metagenome]